MLYTYIHTYIHTYIFSFFVIIYFILFMLCIYLLCLFIYSYCYSCIQLYIIVIYTYILFFFEFLVARLWRNASGAVLVYLCLNVCFVSDAPPAWWWIEHKIFWLSRLSNWVWFSQSFLVTETICLTPFSLLVFTEGYEFRNLFIHFVRTLLSNIWI